jgi:magnesium chelatase subunit D
MVSSTFPFAAIVGQDEMKLALVLNVIDPLLGGVLIMGHRGTAKSTAVRGLAELLPQIWVVRGCYYRCDPSNADHLCEECQRRVDSAGKLQRERSTVAVVDLPLGATEDRVAGSINIERALKGATRTFEPGLIARANRGFLYIDEVNLLEDHLVDLLLDVAVTGRHQVEREGISVKHPARFVLIGSGNPEEGELRPQLLDRFGLHVEVTTENGPDQRIEIVERRASFEDDRESFIEQYKDEQGQIRKRITSAQQNLGSVKMDRALLRKVAELCVELNLDGHRGELTLTRAARALAAFEKRKKVLESDVRRVALISLRHRLRREPFEESGSGERIQQALNKVFGSSEPASSGTGSPSSNGQPAGKKNRPTKQTSDATSDQRARHSASEKKEMKLPTVNGKHRFNLDLNRVNGNHKLGREGSSGKQTLNKKRGRYALSTGEYSRPSRIALDATLRALATSGYRHGEGAFPFSALRFKRFSKKQGSLFIFAIDASGSMALTRITRAREVALGLLRQSYINRDSVAIVVFRGTNAELVLPPSRSMLRAKRALDGITVGGGTPLSAGISAALEVAKRASANHGRAVLLLFTDGNANVSLRQAQSEDRESRDQTIADELHCLGNEIHKAMISTIVIETGNKFISHNGPQQLAQKLGADFTRIP